MKRTLLFLMAILVLAACTQVDPTVDQNLAASARFTDEVWNSGNMDAIDEILAADFVRHMPESWDPPTVEGAAAMKEYINQIRTIYPDFHVEIGTRIAQGEYVAATWTVTGTSSEDGRSITGKGMSMTRFATGKVAEEWVTWDTHSVMQQQGRIPASDTSMN